MCAAWIADEEGGWAGGWATTWGFSGDAILSPSFLDITIAGEVSLTTEDLGISLSDTERGYLFLSPAGSVGTSLTPRGDDEKVSKTSLSSWTSGIESCDGRVVDRGDNGVDANDLAGTEKRERVCE